MTVDEQGRLEPPVAAGEVEAALGFLDYQRATLEWRCSRLEAPAMSTQVAASTMTLGGLLKHQDMRLDRQVGQRVMVGGG
jgi:hypothetical protein